MTNPQHRQAVAAELRAAVARTGTRKADLAKQVGISRAALSRKMSGEVGITVDELIDIALALEVDVCTLMPRTTVAAA